MCLEPEDESCKWLGTEWLNHEDEREENGLPACQISNDSLDAIWFAFRLATGSSHSFLRNLDILIDVSVEGSDVSCLE